MDTRCGQRRCEMYRVDISVDLNDEDDTAHAYLSAYVISCTRTSAEQT